MTRVGPHGAPRDAWEDAQAVAMACVGALVLAGTALSGVVPSSPPFPAATEASRSSAGSPASPAIGVGYPTAAPEATPGRAQVSAQRQKAGATQTLDLNRADAGSLQTLPGVGPILAQRIVDHRDAHGPFRRPEELLQVPGIGSQRYARLRGLIRTGDSP